MIAEYLWNRNCKKIVYVAFYDSFTIWRVGLDNNAFVWFLRESKI